MDELYSLQQQVLAELADGGFADKRTEVEAWRQALGAVKRLRAMANAGHEKLKELGVPHGMLGLVVRKRIDSTGGPG